MQLCISLILVLIFLKAYNSIIATISPLSLFISDKHSYVYMKGCVVNGFISFKACNCFVTI